MMTVLSAAYPVDLDSTKRPPVELNCLPAPPDRDLR